MKRFDPNREMAIKNKIARGFLGKYRREEKREVVYLPLELGFLKLEYGLFDEPGILSLVSFVLENRDDAIAIGSRLEMSLADSDEDTQVTYISENGVSGLQWSDGEVIWGHTYDDDSGPSPDRKVGLAEWVDEMIEAMINPSDEEIEERKRLDKEQGD
jgi:hypothetical protein